MKSESCVRNLDNTFVNATLFTVRLCSLNATHGCLHHRVVKATNCCELCADCKHDPE